MGVMSCSRKDCENIMCDTLTDEGYVCTECKSEFEKLMENMVEAVSDPDFMSMTTVEDIDVREEFKSFMKSSKDDSSEKPYIDPSNINWNLLDSNNF